MSEMFENCSSLTSLDLSSLNTSSVTNMGFMFSGCISLTSLDLSHFNTGNVTNMYDMFAGCSSLTTLDINSFNTSNVMNMGAMFNNCNNLCKVILGQNFSFKGNGSASCILPSPPSTSGSGYTGKWIKEDKTFGPYTSDELVIYYTPVMEGDWIWEIDDSSFIIHYDANGGYINPQTTVLSVPFTPVSFPEATRNKYRNIAWSTNSDGTGISYTPNTDQYTPTEGGNSITFYAQWEALPFYTVNYYLQNVTLDGYDLSATEQVYAVANSTVAAPQKNYSGYVLPAEQNIVVSSNNDAIVNYYYDRNRYTVHYDANEGNGLLPDQQMIGNYSAKMYDNQNTKDGFLFFE